jgi:hypothetical protein
MNDAIDRILAQLKREPSREFVRYWFSLRAGRPAPDRRDIDPGRLIHLLPKLWLWEYDAKRGDFINRLAGGEIVEVFQRNPRGKFLGDWVPEKIVAVARPRYQRVIEGPAICVASGPSYVAGDKRAWCERVIAPMTNRGPKPSIVFGISVWEMPDFTTGPVEREDTEAAFFPVPV